MIKKFLNKKVALIGISKSNIALAKFLYPQGVKKFVFCDKNENVDVKGLRFLSPCEFELKIGDNYLKNLSLFDIIFVSPGIDRNQKEIVDAQKRGSIVSSEIEIFFENCPAKIIGVTGTNGKSTTVTLIGELLKKGKKNVWVGGNLGEPLVDKLDKIKKDDLVVLELSSFQLENLKVSPHISVVLNLTEDHIDRHLSMKNYIDAKANIVRYQNRDDLAILNFDDKEVLKYKDLTKGKVVFFALQDIQGLLTSTGVADFFNLRRLEDSLLDKLKFVIPKRRVSRDIKECVFLKEDVIYYREGGILGKICSRSDIKLIGEHNLYNVMASLAVALNFGIKKDDIVSVIKKFKGLEHRIEFVAEKKSIKFYNDSKATTPESTIAAAKCFPGPNLMIILGGYDKKNDFTQLASELSKQKVSRIVLIGKTAQKIDWAVKKQRYYKPDVHFCSSLKEAVEKSFALSKKGDVVLLSPACASYDMFKNFEERGRVFKKLVRKLNQKSNSKIKMTNQKLK